MVEFNEDGSLRLPGSVMRKKLENEERMRSARCVKVRKELVNHTAPKKCLLKVTLSQVLSDNRFVTTIFNDFAYSAKTPMKLRKISEREFEVEVGSDFKRCTECCSLVGRYREFMYGSLIEEKGGCTFEGRIRSFTDEDYFD